MTEPERTVAAEDRVRVLVVDDDPLARRVVRDALQSAGIIVVAEATDGRDAVSLALHYRPDVVVMDVVMPGMDGITAMQRILEKAPDVRVVMLSTAAEEDAGLLAVRMGASGYLRKDMDLSGLPTTLREATDGNVVCSREFISLLVDELRSAPATTAGVGMRPVKSPLTPREWEVLDLLCMGLTTRQVSDELVLSIETVRTHVKNLMRKLGVRTRAEAVDAANQMRAARSEEQQPGSAPVQLEQAFTSL
jgi:DNA-binding NarL/FixJ family response regulator